MKTLKAETSPEEWRQTRECSQRWCRSLKEISVKTHQAEKAWNHQGKTKPLSPNPSPPRSMLENATFGLAGGRGKGDKEGGRPSRSDGGTGSRTCGCSRRSSECGRSSPGRPWCDAASTPGPGSPPPASRPAPPAPTPPPAPPPPGPSSSALVGHVSAACGFVSIQSRPFQLKVQRERASRMLKPQKKGLALLALVKKVSAACGGFVITQSRPCVRKSPCSLKMERAELSLLLLTP